MAKVGKQTGGRRNKAGADRAGQVGRASWQEGAGGEDTISSK